MEAMQHREKWNLAKRQARDLMVARAKPRGMIPYSELAAQITAIPIRANDIQFFELLGEISREEDVEGRGMLSVVVVHKAGDMQPGPGFFELAASLGRDTEDILRCWVSELHQVHGYWSRKAPI